MDNLLNINDLQNNNDIQNIKLDKENSDKSMYSHKEKLKEVTYNNYKSILNVLQCEELYQAYTNNTRKSFMCNGLKYIASCRNKHNIIIRSQDKTIYISINLPNYSIYSRIAFLDNGNKLLDFKEIIKVKYESMDSIFIYNINYDIVVNCNYYPVKTGYSNPVLKKVEYIDKSDNTKCVWNVNTN